jgi:UDP-3-O-[3-hydroxymyristoyl] glucosamine N-acyltransferase
LGNDVILAGHVGVTDHLTIGDRVQVAAKSAVIGNVPAGSVYSGNPARRNRQVLRAQAALYRLAPIVGDLEKLAAERRGDA